MKSFALFFAAILVVQLAHAQENLDLQQPAALLTGDVSDVRNVPKSSSVRLSPNMRASFERPEKDLRAAALRGLEAADRSSLDRVIRSLRGGDRAAALREWRSLILQAGARRSAMNVDVNALIQHVLRESYIETSRDLRDHAARVRFFNDAKKATRNHLAEVRSQFAAWSKQNRRNPQLARQETIRALLKPDTSRPLYTSRYRKLELRTPANWNNYISSVERQIRTVDNDARLAGIDLQNVLQKHRQTLQTMSNVSKMLSDTWVAVKRKS